LPETVNRIEWISHLLPLPVVDLSHFVGSLVGTVLLFLSWGIWKRLDAAFSLTLAALVLGIVVSLLKGADYEEAILLSLAVAALIPCRSYFYRRSALLSQPFSIGFLATVAAVIVSVIWLGLFSYRHVDYSNELWWQFEFNADAPRFLRGLFATAIVFIGVLAARLMRPPETASPVPTAEDFADVERILATQPIAEGNLAFLGDKRLLFNDDRTAFIMYAIEGGSFIAMGDPVGTEDERAELAWKFRALSDRHRGNTVFYEVTDEELPVYVDLGLRLYKLGEEAVVNLPLFGLEGSDRKKLRASVNRLERDGATFDVVQKENVHAMMPELRRISEEWLADKGTREKGFSLGFFDETYLSRFPIAVVRMNGALVAFANLWPSGTKVELSVDLMRYTKDAPAGVMEYLFTKIMIWGKENSFAKFSLGMAPFSGMDDRVMSPLWNRVGALLFRHGEHFYNFQGLRQYKDKFDPDWSPRYLAGPGGLALAEVLKDTASLISGGLTGIVRK
jgi:phosphatidylglycerol lysyltransferase